MKNRNVFVGSNREGVERVTSETYAYLMESTSLEYETQQNCNLTQIGGVLGSKGYGIALKKSKYFGCLKMLHSFYVLQNPTGQIAFHDRFYFIKNEELLK